MRKLIFIKHAQPQVVEDVPSHEWGLSDAGRERSAALSQRIVSHLPSVVVTSVEPKAVETGRIIAERLQLPCESAAGLEEHDRSSVPMMQSREFISMIALFFKHRDERVLGRESAAEAMDRFDAAVNAVIAKHPDENIAIVTHGTVLSLFVEKHARLDPFLLWRRMGLPSFIVMGLPEMNVLETVERI